MHFYDAVKITKRYKECYKKQCYRKKLFRRYHFISCIPNITTASFKISFGTVSKIDVLQRKALDLKRQPCSINLNIIIAPDLCDVLKPLEAF